MTIFIRLSNEHEELPIADCRLPIERSAGHPRAHNWQLAIGNRQFPRPAFSLTEVLIVIALIVLILAMALPAFNFITGGRSVDAATNQISAFLSRARTEALGLQEYRGVLFYIDPATNQEMMTLVKESPAKTSPFIASPSKTVDQVSNPFVEVWLTLNSDEDHIPLPKGIGIQVVSDGTAGSSGIAGNYDRYVGFNKIPLPVTASPADPKNGGVILFDGYGRLASRHYGFRLTDNPLLPSGTPNSFGQFVFAGEIAANPIYNAATDQTILNGNTAAPLSNIGFVLF